MFAKEVDVKLLLDLDPFYTPSLVFSQDIFCVGDVCLACCLFQIFWIIIRAPHQDAGAL
jgi:hypothetical protein